MTNGSNTMERVRADLLRRAQAQREADLEQSIARDLEAQVQPQEAEETRRSGFGGFTGRLFGRRQPSSPPAVPLEQTPETVREVPEVRLEDGDLLEAPKTPVTNTRRVSNMRFTLPRISRFWASGANGPGSPAATEWPAPMPEPGSSLYDQHQHFDNSSHPAMGDTLQPPDPISHARSTFRPPSSHYTDIFLMGSREARSARNRDERRRKRRHKKRRHHQDRSELRRHGSDGRRRHRKTNRNFLFCFPWVQSRAMRANILRCFVSGLFLIILLSVCKCEPGVCLLRDTFANDGNRSGIIGDRQRRHERLHHCAYSHRHPGHAFLRIWSCAAVHDRSARRSEKERQNTAGCRHDFGPLCRAERAHQGDAG